jgi:glutathione peroxidase
MGRNFSRRESLLLIAIVSAFGIDDAFAQNINRSAYAFSFKSLDGGVIRLSEFAGRPILIVNVASQCGYTPQYAGLKALRERFGERLAIVGVPSNDFYQEPGDAEAIHATAHTKYGVDFPIAEKSAITGAEAHPFYRWAALERPLDVPRWNFHKYLVGRDGHLAAAFPTRVEPTDARVIEAIVREMKAD